MDSGKFWLSLWVAVIIGIVSVVYIATEYSKTEDTAISNAKTCEAVVVLYGGQHVTEGLAICQIGKQSESEGE